VEDDAELALHPAADALTFIGSAFPAAKWTRRRRYFLNHTLISFEKLSSIAANQRPYARIRTAGFPRYGWKLAFQARPSQFVLQLKPAPGVR
jgi:hypothetical protein